VPRATAPALLVYDGTCGFCSAWARWGERHLGGGPVAVRASQSLDLEALGTTRQRADTELLLVTDDRTVRGGADAVAGWLRYGPWWARVAAAALGLAPVRPLARLGYRWVADHRHALPAPPRR
jgi:predicted DCC family thiol-disulfide oxidoreductase YuxK